MDIPPKRDVVKAVVLALIWPVLFCGLFYVGASAALGTYQWQRDHHRCSQGSFDRSVSACVHRREHERYGLFHAWGSNFRAED